jgi:hypothetical protein
MDVVAKRKKSVSAATPTSYPFHETATLMAKLSLFLTANLHTSKFQINTIKWKKLSYSLKKMDTAAASLRTFIPFIR